MVTDSAINEIKSLRRLASSYGIQPSYIDLSNNQQIAAPEVLVAMLQALGCNIPSPAHAPDLLNAVRESRASQDSPPNLVAWNGRLKPIYISATGLRNTYKSLPCRIYLEDQEQAHEWKLQTETIDKDGHEVLRCQLHSCLPYGIHRLEIDRFDQPVDITIFSAPQGCYPNERGVKDLGIFLPLYALQTERSMGTADLTDLTHLAEWAHSLGCKYVGTLPLLAAYLNHPFEPSPYSPVSRLFWNELYVDVNNAPELELSQSARDTLSSNTFQSMINRLKSDDYVDYQKSMYLKRQVLDNLAKAAFSNSTRHQLLAQFQEKNPELDRYARFRATVENTGTTWQSWPELQQNGTLSTVDYHETDRQTHLYAQWLLHEQLHSLSSQMNERDCSLYLDFPIGVNKGGYDVWRHREQFITDVSAGAPPDPFFESGQNWGFPPLHPWCAQQRHHAYFRASLNNHLRYAGMLRLDHVMSLHRIYCVPQGFDAQSGVYVKYPADELYAILCIESHRHQTKIVGENLGTVPETVNTTMKKSGMSGMWVGQFEFETSREQAVPSPPVMTLASLNTHDMPTFTAFWRGYDIDRAHKNDMIDTITRDEKIYNREKLKENVVKYLQSIHLMNSNDSDDEIVLYSILRFLCRSHADSVLINLEDLLTEPLPQNVPGTTDSYPNWRRKAALTLEDIQDNNTLQDMIRHLASLRQVKT